MPHENEVTISQGMCVSGIFLQTLQTHTPALPAHSQGRLTSTGFRQQKVSPGDQRQMENEVRTPTSLWHKNKSLPALKILILLMTSQFRTCLRPSPLLAQEQLRAGLLRSPEMSYHSCGSPAPRLSSFSINKTCLNCPISRVPPVFYQDPDKMCI